MTAGDVVNGLSATSNAISFQPASGVECVITSTGAYNSWIEITDGTNFGLWQDTNAPNGDGQLQTKVFINNTRYINCRSNGTAGSWYSGIQIK